MGWQDAPIVTGGEQPASGWQSAPIVEDAATVTKEPRQNLQERVQDVYGFEEGIERPNILPIPGYKGQEGWTAPEWVPSLAAAIELPGHVARGGEYSIGDVTESSLNVGVPALRGVTGSITKQIPGKLTRKMIKEAPSAEQLKKQSTNLFNKATGSGAVVSEEGVVNMLAGIEDRLIKNGFDIDAHPETARMFNILQKRIGSEADFGELQQMREFASTAAFAQEPKDAMRGKIMLNYIDDYVENLTDDALSAGSGSAEKAASDLSKARALWARTRKREAIDDIFSKAENQASGFENGLRTGFRALLNNKKRLRGFTEVEKEAMRKVVQGDFSTNTLKKIGKFGSGLGQQSNIVGTSIAIGGGAALGGPAGAIAAPLIGTAAQKLGERGTRRAAEGARAIVSGAAPKALGVTKGTQGIPRNILGIGAASALPEEPPIMDEYRRILAGEEFF